MTTFNGFPAELFTFLGDLAENNNRDWFNDNQIDYEQFVVEPVVIEAYASTGVLMGAQFSIPIRMWPIRFLFASRPLITDQVLGIVYRVISMHLVKKAGYSRKTARTGERVKY